MVHMGFLELLTFAQEGLTFQPLVRIIRSLLPILCEPIQSSLWNKLGLYQTIAVITSIFTVEETGSAQYEVNVVTSYLLRWNVRQ